jgi:hypothetical protein
LLIFLLKMCLHCTYPADRIRPLPKHMLPLPNYTKAVSSSKVKCNYAEERTDAAPSDRSKRVKFADESGHSPTEQQNYQRIDSGRSSGLAQTVNELIRSYTPVSQERRPFFCRVCRFQGQSEDEFFSHKASQAHIDMMKLERRAASCKLCRKQFTSPEQLKEHLKGKGHLSKLAEVQARRVNSTGKKFERI